MKKLVILLSLFQIVASAQTFTGTGGVITDNNQEIEFPLDVSNLSQTELNATLGVLQVCVDINHDYNADLKVWLVSPSNTVISLFSEIGGGSDNFTNTCFEQSASTSINSGSAPYTGVYKPQESIGNLNNGQNGNGTWKLRIQDVYPQDQGTLVSWSITFGSNATIPIVFTSSNLPIVLITTTGTIVDEPSIIGTMKIIDNGAGNINNVTDVPNNYNGKINIEYRGNYSQTLPQKPYKIETLNDLEVDTDASLLGMPAESDWALLANYNDKVFMRNQLAYSLFNQMGYYSARTKHCEVVVNGVYMGVFLLSETIKRDNNRVAIAKLDTDENTGINLTGGYIIKNDYWDSTTGWQLSNSPIDQPGMVVGLAYSYPKDDAITTQQKSYIASFINDFETALYSANYADPLLGYNKYMDQNSFIDYFIINELSRNNDGFKKSCYFNKDKNGANTLSKLKAGPVWDFDWAWKNINECSFLAVTDGSGWAHLVNDCNPDVNSAGWYVRLLQDDNFKNRLRCRWDELRTTILNIPNITTYIDATAINLNSAQARHFERWGNLGAPTGTPEVDADPSTFEDQIVKFKNWIATRMAWLDINMPGNAASCNLSNKTEFYNKIVLNPNPAKNFISIKTSNNEAISKVTIMDVLGKKIEENEKTTSDVIINTENFPNGLYFCKIETKNAAVFVEKFLIDHR